MTDVETIVAFLAVAATTNLALIAHLLRSRGTGGGGAPDLLFPAGVRMENFTGESRVGASVSIAAGETAYALVFLSKGCPKCRAVAADVAAAAAQTAGRGVDLWVVTAEWLKAADLGQDEGFEAYFLDLTRIAYAMLNPRRASPAYLFLAPDMIAEAGGFLGDDDWQSFLAQLSEPA